MPAAFQSTVSLQQGFGVPGERFTNGPWRAQSFILVSALASYNIIGATGFSVASQGIAAAGNSGSQIFAGILANPKVYASYGTLANGPLAPTLVLPNQTQAELVMEGSMIVTLPAASNIGDLVIMDNTTGALSTIAPGVLLPSGKSYAYAYVDRYTDAASGLAVININELFTAPVS